VSFKYLVVYGKVEKVHLVFEVFLDLTHKQLVGVLVGDVAYHNRCARIEEDLIMNLTHSTCSGLISKWH
jgi:hypothetical protein